jgi:hypothetical protein
MAASRKITPKVKSLSTKSVSPAKASGVKGGMKQGATGRFRGRSGR